MWFIKLDRGPGAAVSVIYEVQSQVQAQYIEPPQPPHKNDDPALFKRERPLNLVNLPSNGLLNSTTPVHGSRLQRPKRNPLAPDNIPNRSEYVHAFVTSLCIGRKAFPISLSVRRSKKEGVSLRLECPAFPIIQSLMLQPLLNTGHHLCNAEK